MAPYFNLINEMLAMSDLFLAEFYGCGKLKAINNFVVHNYNKFKYMKKIYNVKTVFEA